MREGAKSRFVSLCSKVNGDEPSATRSLTVLVMDADPAVRLAGKSVLEPTGFTVIAVADARAALERLAVLRADLVTFDSDSSAAGGSAAISALAHIRLSGLILRHGPK